MKSGEIGIGENRHARWCDGCNGFHGILYPCKKYPPEVLDEIDKQSKKYVNNLRSRKWCHHQYESGKIPLDALMIFRAMANIEENDWTD